ncbi:RNA polymerase sigma factor [Emticicia soli]|uniref:RNA polymerase sigma factor n=2 Tax=Emticicia soli TaxID=2027878 RepID=A0ABW5J2K3_9BACT
MNKIKLMAETFTDQQVVDGLLKREKSLTNRIVAYLYIYQESITHMVMANNGRTEDAEDVFQEMIIIFLNQVWDEKFKLIKLSSDDPEEEEKYIKISTYLYKLANRIWLKKMLRDKKQQNWEDKFLALQDTNDEYTPLLQITSEEDSSRFKKMYSQLKEDCIKILDAFYFQDKSIREIADELKITEANVKVIKHRCIEKLKKIITR